MQFCDNGNTSFSGWHHDIKGISESINLLLNDENPPQAIVVMRSASSYRVFPTHSLESLRSPETKRMHSHLENQYRVEVHLVGECDGAIGVSGVLSYEDFIARENISPRESL